MNMDDVCHALIERGICSEASPSKSSRGHIIESNRGQGFVKFGTGGSWADIAWLEYEAAGLSALADAAPSICVPRPWLTGTTSKGQNYIVMHNTVVKLISKDYIRPGGTGSASVVGQGLAELHNASAPNPKIFGFHMDGCCGAQRQLNNAEQLSLNWVEFWREFRLGDQLVCLKEKFPEDQQLQQLGEQLKQQLGSFFSMLVVEDIKPSLLHGDLWSGNISSTSDGKLFLFDPACYYGHNEADFGISRMFGGVSHNALEIYHKHIPTQPGWEARADLYELHHHLNHYNLFGTGYRSGAISLMQKLLHRKHF